MTCAVDTHAQGRAMEQLRAWAAIDGATIHKVRLPAVPGSTELSLQMGPLRLDATLGPDTCTGKFIVGGGWQFSREFVRNVGLTAHGAPGLWLRWVKLALDLNARGDAVQTS